MVLFATINNINEIIIGSGFSLVPKTQLAITWSMYALVQLRMYTSLGRNELTISISVF